MGGDKQMEMYLSQLNPQMPIKVRVGPGWSKVQELHPDLLLGWRNLRTCTVTCCFPSSTLAGSQIQKQSQALNSNTLTQNTGVPHSHTKCLLLQSVQLENGFQITFVSRQTDGKPNIFYQISDVSLHFSLRSWSYLIVTRWKIHNSKIFQEFRLTVVFILSSFLPFFFLSLFLYP